MGCVPEQATTVEKHQENSREMEKPLLCKHPYLAIEAQTINSIPQQYCCYVGTCHSDDDFNNTDKIVFQNPIEY